MSISGQQILDQAAKFLGDPYVYGAAGPSSFDCSGLIQYTLSQLGIKAVPRTSEAQYAWASPVAGSSLQPGDLIFSQWPGDDASPGHVAIYAGGGQTIEASSPGQPVHYVPFDAGYKSHVVGYGQVPGSSGGGGSGILGDIGSGISSAVNGLLGLPGDVGSLFDDAATLASGAMWFFNPENWARMIAGLFGLILAAAGLGFLVVAGL